jgi:hypothetical protein
MHAASMTERPHSADETEPSVPTKPPIDPDARPQTSPDKVKVTPLDEDRNVKDGIKVDET